MSPHTLLQRLRESLHPALNLLFPPRCAACLSRLPDSSGSDFCFSCDALLEPVVPPCCQICSEPFSGRFAGAFSCPNCAGREFAFDFAIASWQSTGPLREAIHRFKYGKHIHLRLALARKLHDALADPRFPGNPHDPSSSSKIQSSGNLSSTGDGNAQQNGHGHGNHNQPSDTDQDANRSTRTIASPALPWLITPVPLHPRRFRERRFNQSAELARLLSGLSGIPCAGLLRRTRYTTTQVGLDRRQRRKNLAGAFALAPRATLAAGQSILLVDDVFTTGSTADACSRVLRQAGAGRIIVLTVARG